MSKHTPGPWLVQYEQDGTYAVWTRQPHTGVLATVHYEDINGEFPVKCNAHLIAAAPELLELAEDIASDAAISGYVDPMVLVRRWQDMARAATAKARGEVTP